MKLQRTLPFILAVIAALTGTSLAITIPADFTSVGSIPVTSPSYNATGNDVAITLGFTPPTGANLTIVNNTGLAFISGTFTNLAQGQAVNLVFSGRTYPFVANYYGGTGNDLVLQWAKRELVASGQNNYGELGNGTTADSSLPVPVPQSGVLAGKNILSVDGGTFHTLSVCSDGTVAGWGNNETGQLGDGTTVNKSSPVAVSRTGVLANKTVIAVSAGGFHSLALCSDGTVASWGSGSSGQLGNGSTTDRTVPVLVTQSGALSGKIVVAISAGPAHSLALCSDGTLAAWGYNNDGQLGNGNTANSSVPVAVSRNGILSGKTVTSVTIAYYSNLALCSDGTLAAWGYNYYGQLGNGTSTDSNVPVAVNRNGVLSGKNVVSTSGGDHFFVALCSDGTMVSWGVGIGSYGPSSVPVAVNQTGVLNGKPVVAISTGGDHGLALCLDGTLAAWGQNAYGQFGNGNTTGSIVPLEVPRSELLSKGKVRVGISSGWRQSHVLLAVPVFSPDTRLSALVLGSGTSTPAFADTTKFYSASVPASTNSITVTPTVVDPTATVKVDGVVVASGSASAPVPLALGSNTITVVVKAQDGTQSTFTISVTRGVLNATINSADDPPVTAPAYAATGNDINISLNFAPPTGTTLTIVNNTSLSFITGKFNNLAHGQAINLTFEGTTYPYVANYYGGTGNDLVLQWAKQDLAAWGRNSSGQLGINSFTNGSEPTSVIQSGVLAGKTVLTVSAGENHSLALCSDGTVAAWGANASGQLGNGSNTDSSIPVAVNQSGVLASKTVIAVSAGGIHSLVLCSDGTMAAWGNNIFSRVLGNNSLTSSNTPVTVIDSGASTGKTVVAISAGYAHNLALYSNGTVTAWGEEDDGRLGFDFSAATLPRRPIGTAGVVLGGELSGKNVIAVSAGDAHSLALCSEGTLAAWGFNTSGQLGIDSLISSDVPVKVIMNEVFAGKSIIALSAGGSHSLAVCSDGSLAAWGLNSLGQLGDGTLTKSNVPMAVPQNEAFSGKTVAEVSAGLSHSLAVLSDGTVAAWGLNSSGQLGNGSTINSNVLTPVTQSGILFAKTVASISAGGGHSLALVNRPIKSPISSLLGLEVSSGRPELEYLNPVFSTNHKNYTIRVRNTISSIKVRPTVTDVTATVLVNGLLVASENSSAPIPLAPGDNTITVRVNAEDGINHTIYTIVVTRGIWNVSFTSPGQAADTAARYNASGINIAITLGFAPPTGTNLTIIDLKDLDFIKGQFANLKHGQQVLLPYDGMIYPFVANYYGGNGNDLVLLWAKQDLAAWGDNSSGQLGNNSSAGTRSPVAVNRTGILENKTILATAAGRAHSLALCSDGTVAAWGSNITGQLGNNSTVDCAVPIAVNRSGLLSGKTVIAIAAGEDHSLALCSDGTLATWGDNSYGQLGNDSTAYSTSPVEVTRNSGLNGRTVVAISAGSFHNIALCSDGVLVAWGDNYFGQIGNDSTDTNALPTIVGLSNQAAIAGAAGFGHSHGLLGGGKLVSWGYNSVGQLGNGNATTSIVPTAVGNVGALAGKSVSMIAAGWEHSLALCSDNTLVTWGGNFYGQLGNSSTTSSSVPVFVSQGGILVGKTVIGLSVRENHNLALCSDGTIASWGENSAGQLGNGTTTTSNVPVAPDQTTVLAGDPVVLISAGSFHSLAVVARPPAVEPSISSPFSMDITETAATLGGNIISDGGSLITESGILLSVTSINSNPLFGGSGVSRIPAAGSTEIFSTRVNGLTGITAYSFRAYAINNVGISYSNSVGTFTTLATDVAISMTATPSPAPIGSNVTYTILVTNNSPSAATGASVSDNLPSELTFVSASAPLGWTSSLPAVGASGLVSFEKDTPLAIGQTATIIIIAKVASSTKTGSNIINSAQAVTTGTDSDMSNNIAAENLRVGTASPNFVQLVASGRPNPLTGLFEIDVNVMNTTPFPINGFRLHVDFSAYNIPYPSLRLYNATSSPGAGDVYVDHPYPVNVDGTVSLKLSFYTATRTFPSPFSPVLTAETLASSQLPGTDGSGVQPILKSLPDSTILLEFSSVPGRWYRVHYSSDLQNWSESPVPIQASTDRMQWIDSGAPFTNVPPSKTKSRYYRVNEITAP